MIDANNPDYIDACSCSAEAIRRCGECETSLCDCFDHSENECTKTVVLLSKVQTKKCSNCFETKPIIFFYRKVNGYQSRCKDCNSEVVQGYRERFRNSKKWE